MFSYDMFSYDMFSYDMFSYDMFSYDMFSYDMFSYDMFSYETSQRRAVRRFDHPRNHLIHRPILRADDCRLTDRAASRQLLPLRLWHVRPFSAHVRLVHFHRASEGIILVGERLADAVREEPGRLLRYVQVTMQLHAALTLQGRGEQVDGDHPNLIAERRALQRRTHPDAEPLAALTLRAAPRHGPMIVAPHVERATMRTPRLDSPTLLFEPSLGCLIIGEQAEQFDEGDAFAVCFTGGLLRYCSILH